MYYLEWLRIFVSEGSSEADYYEPLSGSFSHHHDVYTRPDHLQRRRKESGVRQAERARDAISKLFPSYLNDFVLFVSPSVRSFETASTVSDIFPSRWRIDHRLLPGRLPRKFGDNNNLLLAENSLRSFRDSLDSRHCLIVAPTDLLLTARYHYENLLPEDYDDLIRDSPHEDIEILAYRYRDHRIERLIYYPYCPEESPSGGEWTLIPTDPIPAEYLGLRVECFPHILDEQDK